MLLRKTGVDDIARQILKVLFVVGPYDGPAIHVKAAVTPEQLIFNDGY